MGSDLYGMMQTPEHNRAMGAYEERKRIHARIMELLSSQPRDPDHQRDSRTGWVIAHLLVELERKIAEDERRMAEGPL